MGTNVGIFNVAHLSEFGSGEQIATISTGKDNPCKDGKIAC